MPAGLPAGCTAVTPNTEGNMEKRKQMLKSHTVITIQHKGVKIHVLQSRPAGAWIILNMALWNRSTPVSYMLLWDLFFLMNHQGARSNNVLPSCCCTCCSHYYLWKHCANLVQVISTLLKYQWSCRPAETWAFSCQSQEIKKGKIYGVSFSSLGPFTYLSLPPQ